MLPHVCMDAFMGIFRLHVNCSAMLTLVDVKRLKNQQKYLLFKAMD